MSPSSVPLSTSQQGLYFDVQLRHPADYHVVLHLAIEPLDPARLASAWETVMREQPALRSAIRADRDGLSYVIETDVAAPHAFHTPQDAAELAHLVSTMTSEPFELASTPLFRTAHLRTDARDHLLIVAHHLIADGASLALLADRVLTLAGANDSPVAPPADAAVGFAAYGEQQARPLPGTKRARQHAFWDEQLARHETPDLGHWLRPVADGAVGREVRVAVPAHLRDALGATAREAEVSEFALHLATFGLLLSHHAASEHVSVVTPFTDRPSVEAEQTVGCFIRTLPVRVDATRTQTVRAMLAAAGAEVRGAYRNIAFPVSTLVADHPGTHGTYDITFIQDSYPALPAGVLELVHTDEVHFAGRLTALIEQVGDACELVLQYKEGALTHAQAVRFTERWLALLTQVPEALDCPVNDLQPAVPGETEALLDALGRTHHLDWQPTHLGTLFLERTNAEPARIAWADERRTYSNAWAHDAAVIVQRHLLDAVDGTPQRVGILLPRGVDLLAAVFGTLLAGCTYVPMSEPMPTQRLEQIADDAGVTCVLTASTVDTALPAGVNRLDLDTWADLADLAADERTETSEAAVPVELDPDDVLYVEYTSGSTGLPKGVVITHANIHNTALDLERRFPLLDDDVYLLKTSFTFDIFGTEIYGWLHGRGHLFVLPAGQEGDALAVLGAVRDHGVTHINFSPSMLRVLLDAAASTGRTGDLAALRYLFCGGEALTADIVERFFALELGCTLENVYGPTEASMWATHSTVTAADAAEPIAPVGTALNDYRVYAINAAGQACGVDLPGELCIAGAGVAIGYLNRPELNASQFVTNPFHDPDTDPVTMQRLYRTGDLGYVREDGRFAFIRRIDRQVKVGGIRMELGEIEQALLRAEGIVAAAVLVDEDTSPARLAAFFTARSPIDTVALRAELAAGLMPAMVPSVLVQLDALPSTSSGKLDRHTLRTELSQVRVSRTLTPPASAGEDRVAALWRRVLETDAIDVDGSFFDHGGNSISLMRLQLELQTEFGREIRITDLLKHHSVAAQARLLDDGVAEPEPTPAPAVHSGDIAIVGIGLQVPGASDVHDFWANLRAGDESITYYSEEELRAIGVKDAHLRDPHYVRARGRLDETGFDGNLFGIAPAEVASTSPQLRLLYHCFWQACEDAGYDPRALPGRVGVYVGGNDDFAWYREALSPESFSDAYQNFTLATNHFLGTRLSYHFDLTGPSMAALTGCSTSLLTVHLAVQALRAGECDMAVAGGVTLELPNDGGYPWVEGMMLSPDGHCRPFDADAAGTVFSNGAALVLLKPVEAALADGDPLYAVIKGSAVGNDGRRKLSYTAPSEDGQYETIRAAYDTAGIDPATVGYVEAHGTGTLLGDPIEVASLTRAFAGAAPASCVLGSVKGNIGHTDSAAGSVGLGKAALAIKNRYLPGTCNFREPNPNIDFARTPFTVTGRGRSWRGETLRAGINSFGVGGTNVHMIIEQAPETPTTPELPWALLQFSAASPEALAATSERVVRHVGDHGDIRLADAALTLRRGRAHLEHRKTLVVGASEPRDPDALAARLAATPGVRVTRGARTALLFSGQGNQHQAMGRGLYESPGVVGAIYRRWMDEIIEYLPAPDAATFREILFGVEDDPRIHRTEWSQYALFATQFATAKVLESYGVRADVLVGHSIGELTAAALAGVWNLPDAARLVRRRGLLMQEADPGVMVAVAAPAERVRRVIDGLGGVWVSLDNSAQRCVLGMADERFGEVVDRLEEAGLRGTRLHTSHAFHTPLMEDAAAAFGATVAQVETSNPAIEIISNRSGAYVRPGEMTDPRYWSEHITGVVHFSESLRTLLADGPLYALETGPGPSLTMFAAHEPTKRPDQTFVNVLRHAAETTPDEAQLLGALGTLWSAGLTLDTTAHDTGRRVSLPGYVFDRTIPLDAGVGAHPAVGSPSAPAVASGDALADVQAAFHHVLGHLDVAPEDDFFALGGDSLKAAGLSAHLRSLGLEATVADIFAAPTPVALAARFGATRAPLVLAKAPATSDHPLSSAQTRMFLAARMAPGALTYNMPSATWLQGVLDPDRVRLAVRRLVERHEPLRTTFTVRDGEVRQRIADAASPVDLPLAFTRLDGTATPDGDALEGVGALMAGFVRPFDLEAGPLFRMEVVACGAGSLLLFDIHHIVADATSVEVLTRDFSALYGGELEPLERQYADYVHHAVGADVEQALEVSTAAVVAELVDAPSADVLASDHPRGERAPAAGRVSLRLGASRLAAVQSLAETHQATPFMVLLSAWGAVLGRHGACDDLVIGAPVTGRTLPETLEMVGMFVNLMPLRIRPRAAASFGDHLAAVRASVLQALTHQDVPFERVVERLGLRRSPGRHPLFDISFDYHNMQHHDVAIDGIEARPVALKPLAVGMDLVITCTEEEDGLTVLVDYAADLYEPATIEKLVRHFDVLLGRVCDDDTLALGRIALRSDAEHDAIRARLVGAPFTPVHELIARRAGDHPDATAVIDADGTHLSFGRLNALANGQADRLRRAGLTVGEPVALFSVRDANLLIAQLAILKAGGAYVPLDPAQPPARHQRILADTRPRFAFAPAGLPATAAIPHVFDLGACGERELAGFEAAAVHADDPIYTVYTSGSTGTPKGIAVKHRGVANLLDDHRRRGLFAPGDVIISLADPTFDIFTFESLLPLACGAAVHVCPADDQKDAAAIAARIATHGVSHVQLPVSKMSALCGHPRFSEQLHRLRVIVCGGEHFSENLLAHLQQVTSARLFNMYGPTETTVTATVKEFAAGDAVTIGSPVSGSAVLVVDERGMIQPDGVPGELCIAGQGLAAGYTNNPDENQRAFTTLAELPDVAVYRTRDVGVRLANGEFTLSGRLDHQVKVNGNRIELGEIEKTAMRATGVTYAVASVDADDLVLHYTSSDASDLTGAILAEIAAALPRYMTPQRITRVAEMPKLPNHKVDRDALLGMPAAQPARSETLPAGDVPSADLLAAVLKAWQEVLGHPVAPTDNFFDVGGTSFKLMLVNNHLSAALGLDVPLVTLFEHPSPRALAEALGDAGAGAGSGSGTDQPAPSQQVPKGERTEQTISWADLGGPADWTEPQQASAERRIAVIGRAGTLPGAAGIDEHWSNRLGGVVSIARFTRDEMMAGGLAATTVDDPRYVNARGFVAADTFDAGFFGYSAREAEVMDPQMRLLHETAWHALEDAGYTPGTGTGDIALFAGSGTNFAWMAGLLHRTDDALGTFEAMTTNEKDFLATKVAYKLDLTGPAVTVQTACSTSLVAIHEAVQALRRGEADMALAGGVALNFPRREGYTWHEGMIFSRDGVCRPFSADADGTVAGQGCALVVLKPLDRALADGDHIHAVVAGSAVNNDGHGKVGYTAPSVRGQEQVIRAALADAGVDADEVGYVETHGTGTKLGDPVEYAALSAVYGHGSPCALGAVKANIGHLDAAAGVAGFVGAVAVLDSQVIPPMANFGGLNEDIDPVGSLYVPTERVTPAGGVRLAAVSAFGIGGTNAHVILERAPRREDSEATLVEGEHVLPVSALTEDALRRMQVSITDVADRGVSLADASHTLAVGRALFGIRAAALARPGGALAWLDADDAPLAVGAADPVLLAADPGLTRDASAAAAAFVVAVEGELELFDEALRSAIRGSLFGTPAGNPAVDRLAQFVLRVALLRVAGPEALTAPVGHDRMARLAQALVAGQVGMASAITALRTGSVSPGAPAAPASASMLPCGDIDAATLRRLLASRWVRHGDVDRTLFCTPGRRVALPGYAFAPRALTSDIRLDDLGGARSAATEPASSGPTDLDAVLRQIWVEVLGSEPDDDADFLRCGGDSLGSVHLCALVEDRTGLVLSVAQVFADPRFGTIRGHLERARDARAAAAEPGQTAATAPASPAQRRMYAVCALQENTTAYNLGVGYRIAGRLDVAQLRRVFARLVARHDQLRTSFHLEGGELLQRIHDEVPDVVTARRVGAAELEARLAAEPAPFDLAKAPLIRVEVLSVTDELHHLFIDMHHIVGDQQSLAILADDLATALAGEEFGPAPLPYSDYAASLERSRAEGSFEADVAFFTGLLADDLPRLELPTDRSPAEPATFAGARHGFTCSVGRAAIAELARCCGATPYLVFLAAVTRLLGLSSGQREFVLGTATSGRTVAGCERTVGMFVNTLPVRVSDDADRTVAQAIAAARDAALPVLSHQDAPFEAVLAGLGLQPGGDTHPLFDVLLNFVSVGTEELELDGLRLEPLPPGALRSRYALSFSVAERADDVTVDLEYRTELFDAATIERLARHLDQLLVSMVAAPQAPVRSLALETHAERAQRRAALTNTGPADDRSLLDALRASFRTHADAAALRWEGHEWSYADLDRLTDTLAGGLQATGVSVGDRVACLLERDPWQVFARIALTKCGAIEVPLDPQAPADRIRHALIDSDARTVLASDVAAHVWPEGITVHEPQCLTGEYRAPAHLTAASPLIMIYTSGTTGQPKGTLVTHGGVLGTCVDNGYTHYAPGDRVLHLTAYTFDPSLLDIHGALLAGATLVMGSHAHNMDTELLATLLREERVDAGILITAVFHLLMAERPDAVAGMSALYVGGEAMQPWAARAAWDVLGPGRLYNLYGPTEASICTTWFRVDERPDVERMPIGVPARNRELFIVHPDGTDVPRGVAGELCVAGPSLALGYHRRPELTAEKFVDSLPGIDQRLYRTGDRALLDDADRIVYIDRIDRQVKHAGYRIELSEIEVAMQGCPGVVEAVLLHTVADGTSRLDGYYTGEGAPDAATLRAALGTRLPRYMVPQRLTRLTEFPLTPNGKVDRRQLPALAGAARAAEPAASAVATAAADPRILAAFRAVLDAPGLGASDDLFLAGAQSIQAIAVVRRLREVGLAVQVSDLYRHPTAELLTAAVRPAAPQAPAQSEAERHSLAPDQPDRLVDWAVADARRTADAFGRTPASHTFGIGAVTRLHLFSGADTGGFLQTLEGIEVADVLGGLGSLTARHEALRTRLVAGRFEVLAPEALADLPALVAVRDLSRVEAEQARGIVDALAHALQEDAFDGLLWRCVVVRESATTVRIVWAFHHAIFDGFSAGVLADELERLARGETVGIARPWSSFMAGVTGRADWVAERTRFDYVAWLTSNRAVTDAVTRGEGMPPLARRSVPLRGQNPLDAALAAVYALLAEATGQTQVAVGFVADCRRWAGEDWSHTIGEFLDVVPVLLDGHDDQARVAERLAHARGHGLHFVEALAAHDGSDPVVAELKGTYHTLEGRLGLVLVNFQGHIDPGELPAGSTTGPTLASAQVNLWYDDEALHLEWVTDSLAREMAGQR